MSLETQSAGNRQILPGDGQHVGQRGILHLGAGVDGGLVIERLAATADLMRVQLTGGVDHRLAADQRPLLYRNQAGGVARDRVQVIPGNAPGNSGRWRRWVTSSC